MNRLQQALMRMSRNQATATDIRVIRRALHNRQVSFVSGNDAMNLSRGASNNVIVTGDGNVITVTRQVDVDVFQQALKKSTLSAWIRMIIGVAGIGVVISVVLICIVVAVIVWLNSLRIIDAPEYASVARGTPLLFYPDHQSKAVGRLSRGQEVEVLGRIKNSRWLHVKTTAGIKGWVLESTIENVPPNVSFVANPATPTPTSISTIPPTRTLTPTPLPEAAKIFYLIILDASSRMAASFEGNKTKWVSAQDSVLNSLTTHLPSRSNYGLIVLGGDQPGSTQTCDDLNKLLVPLGLDQKQTVIDQIKNLKPGGEASLTQALALAQDELLDQPSGMEKTIFIITGGGDSCNSDDEWQPLLELFEKSFGSIGVQAELIVLADENIEETVVAAFKNDIIRLGLQNVRADVPANLTELESSVEVVVESAKERAREIEPTAIAAEETAIVEIEIEEATRVASTPAATPPPTLETSIDPSPTSEQPTPTTSSSTPISTPQPTSTSTSTGTPISTSMPIATSTPTSTNTPTSISTPKPTPTSTATGTPTSTSANPTETPTPTPTGTPTGTPTSTGTPTRTPTPNPTETPLPTSTGTPTRTPTPNPTETPPPTGTPTPTPA